MKLLRIKGLLVIAVASAPAVAFAGVPVPAPLAGAFGPVGIVVAGAAYVGYRIYKRRH